MHEHDMQHDADPAGAPSEGRQPASLPVQMWAALVDGMAALGTVMIILLMGMIFADIVARNAFGGSLPLISELGALTLVMIVFLQLASAVRHNRLARIELLMGWLERDRPRIHAAVSGLWDLVGAAACGAIAWSTLGILRRDMMHMDFIGVTGVLTLPVWPFRALILAGITIAAIQFLIRAAAGFGTAAGMGRPAE